METICLEMSLKPFKETTDEYIKGVCRSIFESWKPMLMKAECVAIMLWSADGSELLDYSGDMADSFEWAYMIGDANSYGDVHPIVKKYDPDGITLHSRGYKYVDNPHIMTYEILNTIINCFKNEGKSILPGKKIIVGTTFDPGGEFAKSSFKYERHNEICTGKSDRTVPVFVCSYEKLKADDFKYASYPTGIPEGTPFGTFLGRQANAFMKDMGFDFLWFSNGFGFGRDTWSTTGAVFDGESFNITALEETKKLVAEFWDVFRKEFDYPVWTRGTNMSMGIDMASDGVVLKEIYNGGGDILPPCNSPWAALNGNYGLELMGHMSRIAKLPDNRYVFRYYLHDPWFMNSPWYDRYNSQPHDIYLPLAVSSIDKNGNVLNPSNFSILSIDNSLGDMPESCIIEPIPHFVKAFKNMPDNIAPIVWVYPFEEYSNPKDEYELGAMFSQDWFICEVINNGVPLSMVTSTDYFMGHDKKIYEASIIITPVPKANSSFEKCIFEYIENGGRVIFYGNTKGAGNAFKNYFEIEYGDDVTGECKVNKGDFSGLVKIDKIMCGGGISEKSLKGNVIATIQDRPIATVYNNTGWIRGLVSKSKIKGVGFPEDHDKEKYFYSEVLLLDILKNYGMNISFEGAGKVKSPVLMLHRHNNAFIISVYSPSTTIKTKLKFPYGAPILDGYDAVMENGHSTYCFPKAENREIRAFVEQESGIISCCERAPVSVQYRRKIEITGLKNATVRFLAEEYCKNSAKVVLNQYLEYGDAGEDFEGSYVTIDGVEFYEARNITGNLVLYMPFKK